MIIENLSKSDKNMNTIIDDINKPGNIYKFIEQDKLINSIRNEHWKDYNPELHNWLKKYYE
jgi:hypothetical protein